MKTATRLDAVVWLREQVALCQERARVRALATQIALAYVLAERAR